MTAPARWKRWTVVVLWMGVIFGFSSVPSLRSDFPDLTDFVLRKLAHALEFGMLAWLVVRALAAKKPSAFVAALLFSVLYAVTDEYHQSFVPGRSPMPHDVLVDAFGAALGTLVSAKKSV